MQRIEEQPDSEALSAKAFDFMGTQARIGFLLVNRVEELGANTLAGKISDLGGDLPALRLELEAAAQGLQWAAELCAAGRDIVDAALAAND